MKIYGVGFSYFTRVVRVMCQYKGLGYELTQAPFGEVIPVFTEAHEKIHPFKRLPVLIDGDLVLPETRAMSHYIDAKAGPSVYSSDDKDNALINSSADIIAVYGANAVVKDILLELVFPKGDNGEVRIDFIKKSIPAAEHFLTWVQNTMGESDYLLLNRFTVCDAYLLPMIDYLSQIEEPFNILAKYPKLLEYLKFHEGKPYCEGILGKPDMSDIKR